MKARAHIIVKGRVQGVFFRDHTQKYAAAQKVTGWVKNLPDGRVEAVAEGEKENLESFIERVEQGPPLSRVEDVEIDWEVYRGEFSDFRITW